MVARAVTSLNCRDSHTLPGVCLEDIHFRFPDTTGDRLHSYV